MGCTFNGINPLVAIKLWKRIALPKMLYGAELWTLNCMKLSTLEKVQNTFLRVCLGECQVLPLVDLSVFGRSLLFFRRLLNASE